MLDTMSFLTSCSMRYFINFHISQYNKTKFVKKIVKIVYIYSKSIQSVVHKHPDWLSP